MTSSRFHQLSKRKPESAVKTAKRLIKNAQEEGQDLWFAILAYRYTPTEGIGRNARTTLPVKHSLLQEWSTNRVTAKEEFARKKERQAQYYTRPAYPLSELIQGEVVPVQPREGGKLWRPAIGPGELS